MIRLASSKHLEPINDIYNQAVQDGLRTAHTEPIPLTERQLWFQAHSEERYPIFIEVQDETVLGWLSVSPYRSDRQALSDVVEVSYYVDYEHHRQGIGTTLMKHALQFCKTQYYRLIVAILVSQNDSSLTLLNKFGFEEGGRIPDAIRYEGEYRDHLYMFKKLD